MIEKPKFGAACNGCGLCCKAELCILGKILFPGAPAPCPAIILEPGGVHRCGAVMMERAARAAPVMADFLGIGCGCSMSDPDTTEVEELAFDALAVRMINGELPRQIPL